MDDGCVFVCGDRGRGFFRCAPCNICIAFGRSYTFSEVRLALLSTHSAITVSVCFHNGQLLFTHHLSHRSAVRSKSIILPVGHILVHCCVRHWSCTIQRYIAHWSYINIWFERFPIIAANCVCGKLNWQSSFVVHQYALQWCRMTYAIMAWMSSSETFLFNHSYDWVAIDMAQPPKSHCAIVRKCVNGWLCHLARSDWSRVKCNWLIPIVCANGMMKLLPPTVVVCLFICVHCMLGNCMFLFPMAMNFVILHAGPWRGTSSIDNTIMVGDEWSIFREFVGANWLEKHCDRVPIADDSPPPHTFLKSVWKCIPAGRW